MNFEEFQHLARLSIVGVLDPDEMAQFQAGRLEFGRKAEKFLDECRKLNAVFALSLRPCEPDPRTKARLFAKIKRTPAWRKNYPAAPERSNVVVGKFTPELN
ncbi:MAG: hypothetical protein NTZ46_12025 [Verrucomicrobia bacterium]|nr:hypothetical protein [Verrucomicrobiota bacterium]